MAEAVYDSGAPLVITGPCLSSCANYIFVAARRKYVIPGGVVGWHGGIPEAPKDDDDPAAPLIARSRAFIAKVGVDPALFETYPADMKDWPEFVRAVDEGKAPFWSYPQSELKERFSVSGIVDYWFPDCADWDQKMRKIGVPYLFRAGRCD